MSTNDNLSSLLPNLAGEPLWLDGRPDESWLKRIQVCRLWLHQCWIQASHSADPDRTARVADQLLGLLLMMRFIQDRAPQEMASTPAILEGIEGRSVQYLCEQLQMVIPCQILKAIFDPSVVDDTVLIPRSPCQADGHSKLLQSIGRGSADGLPITTFGQFHQLCLSNPCPAHSGETNARKGGNHRRTRGIHYTPGPLVDYLTYRTLEEVMKGCQQRSLASLRVLDPSCGCGTFLIAALRYFLDRHWEQFGQSPQGILDFLSSVFLGGDLDPQAILWSRRSLLLTVWEAAMRKDGLGDHHVPLHVPDLRSNFTCGDFLDSRIAEIDIVLGGPPFVRLQKLMEVDPARVRQYRSRFQTARSGQFDLYMLFFEKAIAILRRNGWLGWSVSNTFLRSTTGKAVRGYIGRHCAVHDLIEFEARKLYPDAVTQIALVMLQKTSSKVPCRHAWIRGDSGFRKKLGALLTPNALEQIPGVEVGILPKYACQGMNWSLDSEEKQEILRRIQKAGTPLSRLPLRLCSGIVTGNDALFLIRRVAQVREGVTLVQDRSGRQHLLESALLKPIVRNRDIHGFAVPSPRTLCIVPYKDSGNWLSEEELLTNYPRTHQYLKGLHVSLGQGGHGFRSAPFLRLPKGPRVLAKRISSGGDFTLDVEGTFLCHSSVLVLAPLKESIDPFFLLGVLNSQLFWSFVRSTMPTMGEGRHSLRVGQFQKFPLIRVQPNQVNEIHRKVIESVHLLLAGGLADSKCHQIVESIEHAVEELYGLR